MKKINEKGQIFSTDLIMGIMVFIFILTLTLLYSSQISLRASELNKYDELRNSANIAANQLLLSPGDPANWHKSPDLSGVSSIALADGKNVLNGEKIQKMVDYNAANYADVKRLLGLAKYNLHISIERVQDKQQLYSFGLAPGSNDSFVHIKRVALLNGEEVFVITEVYK